MLGELRRLPRNDLPAASIRAYSRLLFGSRRCPKRFGPRPFLMAPLVRQRHSARRDLAGEGRGPDPYHLAVAFCMLFHPALGLLRPADRRDAVYRPTLVNSRLTRRDFCCGLGADLRFVREPEQQPGVTGRRRANAAVSECNGSSHLQCSHPHVTGLLFSVRASRL